MKKYIFLVMSIVFTSFLRAGAFEFKGINEVRIESSWKDLTSKAIVKLPSLSKQLEKDLAIGTDITIQLGYDGQLVTEFTGYIADKQPNIPYTLKCEDGMYLLKRIAVNKAYKSITLKALLTELIPDVQTNNVPDVTLSPLRLANTTVAKVLEKLRQQYGLVFYFRGNVLNAGLPYFESFADKVNYHLQKNTIERESNLMFRGATDRKIRLKAISILPDNTTITKEVGDPDGEIRTWHTYNITDAASLEALANEKLNVFTYDGYEGMIKTFGTPYAQHSQIANVFDDLFPERRGSYFIDRVTTSVSKRRGFKREITLGRQVT